MKKMLKICVMAILLSLTLMVSITSCFVGGGNITPIQPINPNNPQTPHVCVFGDWEIIKEATNTENGLRERRCECGKVDQEVIKASNTEYIITYRNTKSVYPEENGYDSRNGLVLPWLEEAGYTFLGWYTAPNGGGQFFDEIPAGSSKNYILYAHWEIIEYEIHYFDASMHTNPLTYTVETDTIRLTDPMWSGLSFAYWTNDNGEKVSEIKKGSTGNINLTANWRYYENLCISPSNSNQIITSLYDETNNVYYFVYKIGDIDNVVLEKYESFDKQYGESISWQKTEEFSVENTIASSAAFNISQSVSQSNSFSTTCEEAKSYSKSENWNIKAQGGLEIFGIKLGIEGSQGETTTNQDTWGFATTTSSNEVVGTNQENSFSSTISYVSGSKIALTRSIDIPESMPSGTYTLACVGKVSVYLIVTYDPETKDYHMDTYSTLKEGYRSATLYTMFSDSNVNVVENDPLQFHVSIQDLDTYINSSYYQIQYDSNGGEGEMPTSIFYSGISQPLYPNQFTRTGYTFSGWQYQSETTVDIYTDEQNITDIAPIGETIVLKAIWIPNEYTVTLDVNGGDILSPSTHTVTFDKAYKEHGALPTPTRDRYTFGGWYYGDELVYDNTVVDVPNNHTLKAKWIENPYTVMFNGNGGISSLLSKNVEYASTYGDLPTASREGYIFLGWFTASSGGTQITSDSPTTSEGVPMDITLYAQWEPKKYLLWVQAENFSHRFDVQYDQIFKTTLDEILNHTDSGYIFKGWYFKTEDDYSLSRNPSGALITTAQTLTIKITSEIPIYECSSPEYDGEILIGARMVDDSCFTGDTLVTLADGSSARIDSLKAGDIVMSWNAITGQFEAMPISLFWNHGEGIYNVISLNFSNGKTIKVVNEHGFFDATLNKYVYINASNYADYVGHQFACQNSEGVFEIVALISAECKTELSSCYSLRTACNDNAIVDGFLTLTYEDIPGFLTYFEFGDDYMYDKAKMEEDIAKYGLYTYDDWKDYVSYEEFVALNGQYLTIAIGKGYITYEDVLILIAGMR